jgi:hypothetical protein
MTMKRHRKSCVHCGAKGVPMVPSFLHGFAWELGTMECENHAQCIKRQSINESISEMEIDSLPQSNKIR